MATRRGVVLMLAIVGCVTADSARNQRREQLRAAETLAKKVPLGTPDGVELRYQMVQLKLQLAVDQLEAGETEAADQTRYEAGLLLDELLAKAPASPRTATFVAWRASVAVLRARHDEAVPLLRRGLELGGLSPQYELFLLVNLPRSLRLSGDCAGTLALPIPLGRAAVQTRLERAHCLLPTPEAACEEVLAALGGENDTPALSASRPARQQLDSLPPELRAACAERLPVAP